MGSELQIAIYEEGCHQDEGISSRVLAKDSDIDLAALIEGQRIAGEILKSRGHKNPDPRSVIGNAVLAVQLKTPEDIRNYVHSRNRV